MEKKHLLSLLSAALCGITAVAAPLTPEQALSQALTGNGSGSLRVRSSESYELVWSSVNRNVYAFNRHGGGFVIAAGDDDMGASLLGYSDCGVVNPLNMPPAMAGMLEAFSTGRFNRSEAQGAHDNIAPLLRSQWDQQIPFYNHCPTDADGNRAVTGCAATAISQVLNYFKYPDCGTGTATATFGDRELSLNLDEHPIDWSNVVDDYSGEYTAAQAAAVANLMHVTGMAISMQYGTGSSGAGIGDCVYGVTTHLGYDRSMRSLRRDFYTVDEWNEMVHGELAANRPVCYFGFNAFGGHAFVVDGYDGTEGDYFHLNWGWSGLSDGYFLLTALDPDNQGTGGSADGYNKNQEAFFDMLPDHGTEHYRPVIGVYGSYGVKVASILKNKDPEFCATQPGVNNYQGFYNVGLETVSGTLGIRCVDTTSGEVTDIASDETSVIPVYGRVMSYVIKADNMPDEGEYKVTPVIKVDGEWIDVSQDASVRKELTLTVTDKRFKFTSADPSTVGIETVGIDEEPSAATEVYDLCGVRVSDPQPGGIYIIRSGSQTHKVRM